MKIRKGFVSNSSSSSFVIAFPHQPKSIEDLKEMMFGKQEWHYDWISEEDVPTRPIAEKVFIKIDNKATTDQVTELLRRGWFNSYISPKLFPGHVDCWDDPEYKAIVRSDPNRIEKQRIFWDKYSDINDQRARAIAEAFCKGFENTYIVVMEFSDNAGEAIEEHTDIFRRLEHIRTSYH